MSVHGMIEHIHKTEITLFELRNDLEKSASTPRQPPA